MNYSKQQIQLAFEKIADKRTAIGAGIGGGIGGSLGIVAKRSHYTDKLMNKVVDRLPKKARKVIHTNPKVNSTIAIGSMLAPAVIGASTGAFLADKMNK